MIKELIDNYSSLFETELLNEIDKIGVLKEIPEGTTIMEIGQYIRSMPLLISGAIKVLREDENGDELLLYFLEKGDTCAMTLSCCLGYTKSEVRAITELDTRLLVIPVQKMDEWVIQYKSWRNFVFNSYYNRLTEMFLTIDSIAFMKMDERLLKYLKDKIKITKNNIVKVTHLEIAVELHTSRVVISRLLKKLENKNKIELHRNYIKVF